MKKLKYILLLLVTCVAFSVTGVAMADTAYPDGKGFDGLVSSSSGQAYLDVGNVDGAELTVNTTLGGGLGVNSVAVLDLTFKTETNQFVIGLIDGENVKDYVMYYNDGSAYKIAVFKLGVWNTGMTPAFQHTFNGNVQFRFTIHAYGDFTLECYVPSSNTVMDLQLTRDQWVEIVHKPNAYPFTRYDKTDYNGTNVSGKLYFPVKNVLVNTVSVSASNYSQITAVSDNFTDPSTFATNFTGNDAFNSGVTAETIVLPSLGNVSFFDSTFENVTALVNAKALGTDFIRSEKSYKGALTIDLYANTTGPNVVLGMLSDTTQKLSYVVMDFNGYGVYKDEEFYAGDYNKSHWANILGEDASKFYTSNDMNIAAGDVKVTLQINADGTGDVYLTYLNQTLGTGLATTPYKLGDTIGNWFTDIVTNGGKIVFAGQKSIWDHNTTIDKIVVKDGNGTIITEDDFSSNNFNGNGLQLWKTVAENHQLPDVDGVIIKDNAVVCLDKQNVLDELELFNLSLNVKATSGSYTLITGMTEKGNVSTATNSITFGKDLIQYAVGTQSNDLSFEYDFDNTTANFIKLTAIKKTGVATLKIGDTVIAELENFTVDGYVGIQAEDSIISYVSATAKSASAPEIIIPSNFETMVGKALDLTPSIIDEIYSFEDMTVVVKVDGNEIADYHAYSFATTGTFTVSYVVTNPMGLSDSGEFTVEVNYAPPTIDVSGIDKYYYTLDKITFAPVVTDSAFDQVQVTMVVTENSENANGVDGLTFTPEKEGVYSVTFTATNGANLSSTATVEIVVSSGGIQSDIYTKFDSQDYSDFDTQNVTAGENCGLIGAQGRFGTAKNIRNFVLMARVTGFATDCTDITVYLAKTADSEYSITFTKGSTKITVVDASGSSETDIGVDVFSVISDGSLVVQLTVIGKDVELSLMYGDLPYEILNTPVASLELSFAKYGKIGISSVSGGVTLDRFIVVNYSTYDEIPDDIVPPDPEPPKTPEQGGGNTNDGNKGCSCGGSITSTFSGLLCLAVVGLAIIKRRKN